MYQYYCHFGVCQALSLCDIEVVTFLDVFRNVCHCRANCRYLWEE